MMFKDQAQALLARWESLTDHRQIEALAFQTAIALSQVEEVPVHVFDALDRLLDEEFEKLGRSAYDVTAFLRTLAGEPRAKTRT